MTNRETRNLEFKLELTKTYLKTVSAYANYCDGEIRFGVDDNGKNVGLKNPKNVALDIENQINGSLKPVPNFTIEIDERESIIKLFVTQGFYKPYLYNGKAYKRSDSSTVEVDRLEFNRLTLEGMNEDYEALSSKREDLRFVYLEKKLIERLGITDLNKDIFKTLNLYSDKGGYNIAAELLSDSNSYPCIEITHFGSTINEIIEQVVFNNISNIEQLDKVISMFDRIYKYEVVKDAQREIVELIPLKALREAVANAIVHRVWDIKTSIKISLYQDRVEIVSPGGLPTGISDKEYLNGQISILRNPIFGNVFFRLGYIEKFGTGIRRIMSTYENSYSKPKFQFFENSIIVILPRTIDALSPLSKDESIVFNILNSNRTFKRKEIEEQTGFNKDKVIRLINRLMLKSSIERIGSGPEAKYIKK